MDERQEQIKQLYIDYNYFYNVGGRIALVLFGVWIGNKFFSDPDSGYLMNVVTEGLGIFAVVILLNYFAERREEKRDQARLVQEAGSSVHPIAIRAIEQLCGRQLLSGDKSLFQNISFHRSDLHEAPLTSVNFRGTQFTNVDLRGAMLWLAELPQIRVVASQLQRAHIISANLQGAIIQGCNLVGVHFNNSNLEGSDLYFNGLQEANFSGANLKGANLKDASLERAFFDDATQFDGKTILPDGSFWKPGTDLTRFTDTKHSDFWRSPCLDNPFFTHEDKFPF